MKRFICIIIFSLFSLISFSQPVNPVAWTFSSEQKGDTVLLKFHAEMQSGWHLYDTGLPEGGPVSTSFSYEDSSSVVFIGKLETSIPPEKVHDNNFNMDLRYYSNEVVFTRTVRVKTKDPFVLKGSVEYMSCNDENCISPTDQDFLFHINKDNNVTAGKKQLSLTVAQKKNNKDDGIKLLTNQGKEGSSSTLWLFFFFSFLAGLAAIFTPCVFPMIPMTVSFFMHGKLSKTKSIFQSLYFGLSIIVIYTLAGTLVAVIFGPDAANWMSTHWLPNILFFLIFLVFAFSLLGMYEIVLPGWMVNKSDRQADKGGLFGPFFMALTLVLVSFSCTGPIVGAILVESAGGDVLKPIVGMFGFSMAFALPFTLFALFPEWLSNLPKSGGWLNSFKVTLGFLELALGLKFLSIADQTYHWGILDREVYLALWIVLFSFLGLYYLGKIKFKGDSDLKYLSFSRLVLSVFTFTFVVYMIPGMFGAPLKAISGYIPPMTTLDFDFHKIVRNEINLAYSSEFQKENQLEIQRKYSDFLELPHGLNGYFDYKEGMAVAKKLNKPVFIDFTGHGCVNCRKMEASVWSDPRVLQILENDYVIIALYIDDKTKLPEDEWVISSYDGKVKKTLGRKNSDFQISEYGVNAQPYYVLLDYEGNKLVVPKAYDLNTDNFVEFLDSGLKSFENRKMNNRNLP